MRSLCDILEIDINDAKYASATYLGSALMDLVSLRYFAETARQRSISKAAVSLGVVQPALSRRIQLLEERLGEPLLMRHRRGVEPTEAGLLVLERADLILRLTSQLENEVRSQRGVPAGQVGIGFPPSIGSLLIGGLLAKSVERYPRVELHLQEDYSPAVREALIAGRIDIGIMSCEAQHPDLAFKPLFEEAMWVVGRSETWPFRKRRLDPKVLDDLPIVVGSFMRTLLERHQTKSDFRLRVIAEADSFTAAMAALYAGVGFLVVPPSSVDRELASKEFLGAPLNGLSVSRGLFHHRDRPLTQAAQALTDLIHEEVRRLCISRSDILRSLRVSTDSKAN
jgi:LysR family nitrogen assimilation transcriptional regulator